MSDSPKASIRLDKWLWAARFYKTRGIARDMIQGGKVRYNGQRSKPSKLVELGATINLSQGVDEKEVIIDQLSEQRRGAPDAQKLYHETEQSIALREKKAQLRKLNVAAPKPDHKPDKKQRRELIKTKIQQSY